MGGSNVATWVAVGSLVVALTAIVAAEVREYRRQKHEVSIKDAEFENQRQADLRTERREAYRTFARITKTVNPAEPYKLSDLALAFSEIELLTDEPKVLETARDLFGSSFEARKVARKAWESGTRPAEKDEHVLETFRQSQEARDRFLDAARFELGLPPRPELQWAPPELRELMQPLEAAPESNRDKDQLEPLA
jgi:hypothetical protein